MIRAGLLALALSGPVAAQGTPESLDCLLVWGKASSALISATHVAITGAVGREGDWCTADDVVIDLEGQYTPDWHIDRLRFRGTALLWVQDETTPPEGLELVVEGLRLVVQTGYAQTDWLFAAQARPNAIEAEVSLAWDPAAKVLRLEGLSLDFPGENLVEASASLTGVDLSSPGAMQMSLTGFALTEADLRITTHGLFEWYVLTPLGSLLLPQEGDIGAAFAELQAGMTAFVGELPEQSFATDSKAALRAVIEELPNPSGELTVALRAAPGLGPVRLGGYAVQGMTDLSSELDQLLQGVTVDVGWSHTDAP